jgi:hypothetical protein
VASGVPASAADQAAEKLVSKQEALHRRLKPHSVQCTYRSAEALRHPKTTPNQFFPQLRSRVQSNTETAAVNRFATQNKYNIEPPQVQRRTSCKL